MTATTPAATNRSDHPGAAVPNPSGVFLSIAVELTRKALRIPVEPLSSGAHVSTPTDVPLARVSVTSVQPDLRAGTLSGEARVIVYGKPEDSTYGEALAAVSERAWSPVTERGRRFSIRPQALPAGEVGAGEVRGKGGAAFGGLVARTYVLSLEGVVPTLPIVSSGDLPPLAAQSLAGAVTAAAAKVGEAVEVSAGRIETREREDVRTATAVVAVRHKVQPGGRSGVPYGSGSGGGPGVPFSEKVERALPGTFVPNVGRIESATAQGFRDGALRVAVTVKAMLRHDR